MKNMKDSEKRRLLASTFNSRQEVFDFLSELIIEINGKYKIDGTLSELYNTIPTVDTQLSETEMDNELSVVPKLSFTETVKRFRTCIGNPMRYNKDTKKSYSIDGINSNTMRSLRSLYNKGIFNQEFIENARNYYGDIEYPVGLNRYITDKLYDSNWSISKKDNTTGLTGWSKR